MTLQQLIQTHLPCLSAVGALLALGNGCQSHNHRNDYEIPRDTYAIVASHSVASDVDWNAAIIQELQKKYPNAPVLIWRKDVEEVREELVALKPSFTAFAVKPGEAGVHFTIAISHLTRELDEDPYTDTFWGVITGYDADAAQKVAAAAPISIERALDCSGCDITVFNKAWRYSEDHRGTMKTWDASQPDAKVQESACDTDNTVGVLERLQKDNIQFLATSGHATQHDWQMGYCGPNMTMVHRDGKLYSVNTKHQAYPAHSDEPKVYFANGNCLIGDIDHRDCMALSWMRDGGVRQMMGYTVTTWFGAQGWGTLGLFGDASGMTTAAEAFHFTNASIVETLEKAVQKTGATDIRQCRIRKIAKVNRPMTRKMLAWYGTLPGDRQLAERDYFQQIIGNLHDRDTVCFYGDPALDARIANGRFTVLPPIYHAQEQELLLTLRANKDERKGAAWFRLPDSWKYDATQLIASEALGTPDICLDNMIRFPNADLKAGNTYTVTLRNAMPEKMKPCPQCTVQ